MSEDNKNDTVTNYPNIWVLSPDDFIVTHDGRVMPVWEYMSMDENHPPMNRALAAFRLSDLDDLDGLKRKLTVSPDRLAAIITDGLAPVVLNGPKVRNPRREEMIQSIRAMIPEVSDKTINKIINEAGSYYDDFEFPFAPPPTDVEALLKLVEVARSLPDRVQEYANIIKERITEDAVSVLSDTDIKMTQYAIPEFVGLLNNPLFPMPERMMDFLEESRSIFVLYPRISQMEETADKLGVIQFQLPEHRGGFPDYVNQTRVKEHIAMRILASLFQAVQLQTGSGFKHKLNVAALDLARESLSGKKISHEDSGLIISTDLLAGTHLVLSSMEIEDARDPANRIVKNPLALVHYEATMQRMQTWIETRKWRLKGAPLQTVPFGEHEIVVAREPAPPILIEDQGGWGVDQKHWQSIDQEAVLLGFRDILNLLGASADEFAHIQHVAAILQTGEMHTQIVTELTENYLRSSKAIKTYERAPRVTKNQKLAIGNSSSVMLSEIAGKHRPHYTILKSITYDPRDFPEGTSAANQSRIIASIWQESDFHVLAEMHQQLYEPHLGNNIVHFSDTTSTNHNPDEYALGIKYFHWLSDAKPTIRLFGDSEVMLPSAREMWWASVEATFEFLAHDRGLDKAKRAELRSLIRETRKYYDHHSSHNPDNAVQLPHYGMSLLTLYHLATIKKDFESYLKKADWIAKHPAAIELADQLASASAFIELSDKRALQNPNRAMEYFLTHHYEELLAKSKEIEEAHSKFRQFLISNHYAHEIRKIVDKIKEYESPDERSKEIVKKILPAILASLSPEDREKIEPLMDIDYLLGVPGAKQNDLKIQSEEQADKLGRFNLQLFAGILAELQRQENKAAPLTNASTSLTPQEPEKPIVSKANPSLAVTKEAPVVLTPQSLGFFAEQTKAFDIALAAKSDFKSIPDKAISGSVLARLWNNELQPFLGAVNALPDHDGIKRSLFANPPMLIVTYVASKLDTKYEEQALSKRFSDTRKDRDKIRNSVQTILEMAVLERDDHTLPPHYAPLADALLNAPVLLMALASDRTGIDAWRKALQDNHEPPARDNRKTLSILGVDASVIDLYYPPPPKPIVEPVSNPAVTAVPTQATPPMPANDNQVEVPKTPKEPATPKQREYVPETPAYAVDKDITLYTHSPRHKDLTSELLRTKADADMFLLDAFDGEFNRFQCELKIDKGYQLVLSFANAALEEKQYQIPLHVSHIDDAVDVKMALQSYILNQEGIEPLRKMNVSGEVGVRMDHVLPHQAGNEKKSKVHINPANGMLYLAIESFDRYENQPVKVSLPLGLADKPENKHEANQRRMFVQELLQERFRCQQWITKREVMNQLQQNVKSRETNWIDPGERIFVDGHEDPVVLPFPNDQSKQRTTLSPASIWLQPGGNNPSYILNYTISVNDTGKRGAGRLVRSRAMNLHTANESLALARATHAMHQLESTLSSYAQAHPEATWALLPEAMVRKGKSPLARKIEEDSLCSDKLETMLSHMTQYDEDIAVKAQMERTANGRKSISMVVMRANNTRMLSEPYNQLIAPSVPKDVSERMNTANSEGQVKPMRMVISVPESTPDTLINHYIDSVKSSFSLASGEHYSSVSIAEGPDQDDIAIERKVYREDTARRLFDKSVRDNVSILGGGVQIDEELPKNPRAGIRRKPVEAKTGSSKSGSNDKPGGQGI